MQLLWARYRGLSQRGGVWIAKRAADGIRSCPHFKPLQEGFGLRVIKESLIAVLKKYADGGIRQNHDRIAGFETRLANLGSRGLVRELPNRHCVVHKGIVKSFGSFVRER